MQLSASWIRESRTGWIFWKKLGMALTPQTVCQNIHYLVIQLFTVSLFVTADWRSAPAASLRIIFQQRLSQRRPGRERFLCQAGAKRRPLARRLGWFARFIRQCASCSTVRIRRWLLQCGRAQLSAEIASGAQLGWLVESLPSKAI